MTHVIEADELDGSKEYAESSEEQTSSIIVPCSECSDDMVPTQYDVICGRGKESIYHTGNKRFRKIIEKNRERYQNAKVREHKTRITSEIIEYIQKGPPPGRFLKIDPETSRWEEVDDEFAKDKVSHALRSAKDPNRQRIRKQRRIAIKKPSKSENEQFKMLLQEQQERFNQLVEKSTIKSGS